MSSCCGPALPSAAPVPAPGEAALQADQHRDQVRGAYAQVARAADAGVSTGGGCCGVDADAGIQALVSSRLGYSEAELAAAPRGADLGLGCGNPRAIAALRPGEVVVDLGSGAGFDCFLAAAEVGPTGRVIGVDMTPEMISRARRNAQEGRYGQVEFRLGEIEHLPVEDGVVDVILSNCVINLSPDKAQVFREAFRVLKRGGRLAISDVVATVPLPPELRADQALIAGCIGNAALLDDLRRDIEAAGFCEVRIAPKDESRDFIRDWAPGRGVEDYVVSATIEGVKPSARCCG
jgi:SAM-dependent methyltransferase